MSAADRPVTVPAADRPGTGTGPVGWRAVLPPHEDVLDGDPAAGEYALDLHVVASSGRALPADPVAFLRRTHVTVGLREVADVAARRLSGDRAAPAVLSLESGFGAGKTHTMLTLWHLASGVPAADLPAGVRELRVAVPAGVRRAALVGTHLPATGSVKQDGTVVATAWGELAWQLGGRDGFALVADADAARISPADGLRELIAAHAPCLVLLDEWVAYARQLWRREDLPAGTFDTQLTFLQGLTEAVRAVPGALLAIGLPVDAPAAGPDPVGPEPEIDPEQEAVRRLRAVVGRVAMPWRSPGRADVLEIARRRLFADPGPVASARIAATAERFARVYAAHPGVFPADAGADPDRYARRIAQTYPIHPELADLLLDAWSTLPGFQRTRDLLRVLAATVRALAEEGDQAELILPGTVPLHRSQVRAELTRHLPEVWHRLLETDVDGPASAACRVEARRPGLRGRATARRLARSVFLASAPHRPDGATADPGPGPAGDHRPGPVRPDVARIRLGTAVPGEPVGELDSTLDLLRRHSTHLHHDGDRIWYAARPSVSRLVTDRVAALRERPDEVWQEVLRRLPAGVGRPAGGFTVQIAPAGSAEVPDGEELRLVVLDPRLAHTRTSVPSAAAGSPAVRFAADVVRHRGAGPRHHRNRLVFLAVDAQRAGELAEAVREVLAWDWVHGHAEVLALTTREREEAGRQRRRAEESVTARLFQAYPWVLVPEQPDPGAPVQIAVERVGNGPGRVGDRVAAQLRRAGLLAATFTPAALRRQLDGRLADLWQDGHVSVAEVWQHFCRHPYLPRLPDRAALLAAVAAVTTCPDWQRDGFALATGHDPRAGYLGLVLPRRCDPAAPSGPAPAVPAASPVTGPGPLAPPVIDGATLLVAPAAVLAGADRAGAGGTVPGAGGSAHDAVAGEGAGQARELTDGSAPGRGRDPGGRFRGSVQVDPRRAGWELARLDREVLAQLATADGVELEISVRIRATAAAGFPEGLVRAVTENARTLRFREAAFLPGGEDDETDIHSKVTGG